MEKWVVAAKRADFYGIAKKYGIDPVLARIIRNRDVIGDPAIQMYLRGGLEDLHLPREMKDMEKAIGLIMGAVRQKKKVRIIGDYDIDGVCSTAILFRCFTKIGVHVDTYIPHRVMDGYGLNADLVVRAIEDGVDLLVTCDNGISAYQEIASAKEGGMEVLITDHHDIPYEEEDGERIPILPPADAVVNPKQEDCPYPFKGLCGAAVAFKLVCALHGEDDRITKTDLEEYLVLAAIATVGDVMELQGENRILVKEGLKRLPGTKNAGLKALLRANGLEGEVTAYHVGFVLGPCINASGRLDTARRSLELLLEEDAQRAAVLAGDLVHMNESRKSMTAQQVEEALRLIQESALKEDRVLVVYLPKCHESLAGIVAGRVREQYHRPVFILTDGEGVVKGSGRSIEAYPMYDEMVKCSDLFIKFGGHPMAAGLSMEREKIEELRRRLNEQCTLDPRDMAPKFVIDVPMPIGYVTEDLIMQMKLLEPFGKGNTKPLFAQKGIRVEGFSIVGKKKNVAKMTLEGEDGSRREGIYFGDMDKITEISSSGDLISILYYPQINEYQGRKNIQIVIQSVRADKPVSD